MKRALLAVALLGSCRIGPEYETPALAAPATFVAPAQAGLGLEDERWWRHFGAPVLDELGARLEQVEITDLREGTFFAELVLRHGTGVTRLSARPSDALALAVRQEHPVPIVAAEEVVDEAGVLYDADETP